MYVKLGESIQSPSMSGRNLQGDTLLMLKPQLQLQGSSKHFGIEVCFT